MKCALSVKGGQKMSVGCFITDLRLKLCILMNDKRLIEYGFAYKVSRGIILLKQWKMEQ